MGVKWGSSQNHIKGNLVRSFDFSGTIESYERPRSILKFGDVTLIEGESFRPRQSPSWTNRNVDKVDCELEYYFWNHKFFKASAKFYNIKLTEIKGIKKYLFTKHGYPTNEESVKEEGESLNELPRSKLRGILIKRQTLRSKLRGIYPVVNKYQWNMKDIFISFEESEFPTLLVISKIFYGELQKADTKNDLKKGIIYDYSFRRKYGSLSKFSGVDTKTIERLSPDLIRVDLISLYTPDEGWTRSMKGVSASRISRTKYEINCETQMFRSIGSDIREWESIKRYSSIDSVRKQYCK